MNSDSKLSDNLGHSLSDVSKLPPIGMAEVFSKLHCNPEIFAKCFKVSTHFLKYLEFLFTNVRVSSAKVSDRNSFLV